MWHLFPPGLNSSQLKTDSELATGYGRKTKTRKTLARDMHLDGGHLGARTTKSTQIAMFQDIVVSNFSEKIANRSRLLQSQI